MGLLGRRVSVGRFYGLPPLLLLSGALVLALVLLGGCGSDSGAGEETTSATVSGGGTTVGAVAGEATVEATAPPSGGLTAAAIEVRETEFGLEPREITLSRPGVYVFEAQNTGNIAHALAIRMEGTDASTRQTGELNPGESAELEVPLEDGTYELYCPVDGHEGLGMKTTVRVEEPSGG